MATSSGFLVEVDGASLATEVAGLLTSAYVDDSRNLPDTFMLRFRDADHVVLATGSLAIGSVLRISVLTSSSPDPQLLVAGEVTALEAEFDSGGTFTVVRGYDMSHRLFRGRHSETFTQATVSDVATRIAQRAQIPLATVEATSSVHDQLSQCGTTDWSFLSGLARDIGFEMAVREGKFEFRKPEQASTGPEPSGPPGSEPLVLHLGRDLLRLRAAVSSSEQVAEVQVRGWDVAQKQALVATAPAETSVAALPAVTPATLAETFGDPVLVAADGMHRTQADVDAAAAALADRVAGTFAELEGLARGNPQLRAGAAVSIDGMGEPWDGKYTVTSSRHQYDPATGYTSAFSVTGRQDRSLYGLASGGGQRSASGLPGVAVAVVSDVADPEGVGRVKVTYPWLSDTFVSDWARTVQPGAGADRGHLVLPEVGDEVLVAFEGDSGRPYVLGGLYNGVDHPASGPVDPVDAGSGAVNRRSFVSRTGHRIDLLDGGGAEGVAIETGDGALSVVLDGSGTAVTVHSDGTVTVKGTTGVTVDAGSGSLELKGGQVTLKASGTCTISGSLVRIN